MFLFLITLFTACFTIYCVPEWSLTPLENFNPSLESKPDQISLDAVTEIREKYLKESHTNHVYPVLTNLGSNIGQLSGDNNCFVVADNFQIANIYPLKFPVILRHPKPYLARIRDLLVDTYKIIFGVGTLFPKNVSAFDVVGCPVSKYNVADFLSDYCLGVNYTLFSLLGKPTTCIIHLGIFPPLYAMQRPDYLVYPALFYFRRGDLYRRRATPSMVPIINVVIPHYSQENTSHLWNFVIMKKWITHAQSILPYAYTHDIFVVLNAVTSQKSSCHGFFESFRYIETADVLRICPACWEGNRRGTISKELVQLLDRQFERQAFPGPNEKMIWDNSDNLFDSKFVLGNMLRLTKLNQSVPIDKVWKESLSSEHLMEKVSIAHANVWRSVLRNFTFLSDQETKILHVRDRHNFVIHTWSAEYPKSRYIFPYYTPDTIKSLRFMGCGRQGTSPIPFQELTNVFDMVTWLCIIFTALTVPTLLRGSYGRIRLSSQTVSIFKMLVEQGGPFLDSVANKTRFRSVLGPLLLMGIVLSNAYKNTNIYNMVIPRKPVLYNYFQELVTDNFKVFSRPSSLIMYRNLVTPNTSNIAKLEITVGNYDMYLISEVVSVLYSHNGVARKSHIPDYSPTSLNNAVLNGTRLQSESVERVSSYLLHRNITRRVDWFKVLQDYVSNLTRMQLEEAARLFGVVEKCQKTAVVLPDHLCKRFYSRSEVSDVFIGQESYSEMDWMFFFSGLVPPHFIRRIHRIAESGVWEWWMHVLNGGSRIRKNFNFVNAANMDGNIVIIFFLWGVGVGFSSLCHLLEYHAFLVGHYISKVLKDG